MLRHVGYSLPGRLALPGCLVFSRPTTKIIRFSGKLVRAFQPPALLDSIAQTGDLRRLETIVPDVLCQQRFELFDIFLLLCLNAAPECLQVSLTVRIGDILIVPPQAIEPAAQIVDQIVIMVGTAAGFTDVLVFFLFGRGHSVLPFHQGPFKRPHAIKKPMRPNTHRCLTASVYSLISPLD